MCRQHKCPRSTAQPRGFLGASQPCTTWTQASREVTGRAKAAVAAVTHCEWRGLSLQQSLMYGLGRFSGLCTEGLQWTAVIFVLQQVLLCFPGDFPHKVRKHHIWKITSSAPASSYFWRSSPVTPLTQLISSKPQRCFLDHSTKR